MKSYTNKLGEKVEVSTEHLDTAVTLKIELQKASPSFRCSWGQHKKLMEQEGFVDSENSENYRQLVKKYQKSIGKLDSVEAHANKVSLSTLESIKEAVGEMSYAKREVQVESRKLGKLKRSLTDTGLVSEQIRDAFINDIDWSLPEYAYKPTLSNTGNSMIVVVGDWHIGATIENSNGNYYNFDIATRRIELLKEKVIKHVSTFNVSEIVVANIGDVIEGLYMRNFNQPFEAEFHLAEQISKVTKLLLDFAVSLTKYCNVKYFGIAGNHDRWFFDKNTADADNAMKIINESVKTIVELSEIERLSYISVDNQFNYEHMMKIGNKTFKFVHGDMEGKNMSVDKHCVVEKTDIDCLVMGHYHYHQIVEGNYGKLNIINGSLMGRNNYSRKFKATSNASQTLIVVDGDDIIPIRVDLQIN